MVADRLKKGSAVYVEGRWQSRSGESKQGEKRTTLEVIADKFQFLTKNEKSEEVAPVMNSAKSAKKETTEDSAWEQRVAVLFLAFYDFFFSHLFFFSCKGV